MSMGRPPPLNGEGRRRRDLNVTGGLGRALGQVARAPPPSLSLDAEVEQDFGGRFLPEYSKQRLLGRGACGAVWLATCSRTLSPVAVKQVVKGNSQKSKSDERAASTEVYFADFFFEPGGVPKVSATAYPGINHLARLLDARETPRDFWLVMEFGGRALTKALYEIKGEFMARGAAQPRERVYRVHHLRFYEAMKQEPRLLRHFIRQVVEAIQLLSEHGVVHADLKPDNLLLGEGDAACDVRLCDFGSAFMYDQPGSFTIATPEYMPPETLRGGASAAKAQQQGSPAAGVVPQVQPWSFDMWSLGAIWLELCYGVPHWLSYKCRVRGHDGKDHTLSGLFAVQGRDHDRIYTRQQDILADGGLRRVLREAPGVPLDQEGLDLLQRMLRWHPEVRISPREALMHPFLAGE